MGWLNEDSARRGGGRADFYERVEAAVAHLRGADPVLAGLIGSHGPCTLSPAVPYFSVVVEAVVSQQLSTKAARAIHDRLRCVLGRKSPRPSNVLKVPDEDLLAIGFSRSKARYLKNAARAFRTRRLGERTFAAMSDADVVSCLTSIEGIGEWSAHMFLIFALGRLDVFPLGDLGLRNAMASAYRLRKPPSPARLRRIGDKWRPYRTVGTWYLWESYDNG